MKHTILTAAVLTVTLGAGAHAATLDQLGRELASAARSAGLKRVGVAGIEAAERDDSSADRSFDDRMTQALVNAGKVQVVERAFINKLMGERALSRSGAAEPRGTESALSAADGVVIGRWTKSPEGVLISARLVSPDDGVIIAAGEALVTEPGSASGALLPPPAPDPRGFSFEVDVPKAVFEFSDPLSDLIAEGDSGAACAVLDRKIKGVLDLKARYWALQERKGRGVAEPTLGASSEHLRERAAERLAFWRAQKRVPALTPDEMKQFVKSDSDALALRSTCGVESAAQVAARR